MAAELARLTFGTSTFTQGYDYFVPRLRARVKPDLIGEALAAAAGAGMGIVALRTKEIAAQVLQLLADRPYPTEVTVEPTGEISLEWFKDPNHVVVLTVDDQVIRWAATVAPNAPSVAGAEIYTGHVPAQALQAIQTAT
jgi:hypothetical protein